MAIPEPTPADWGIGVTVCIASFVNSEAIVGVCDSMLSTVDMSADNLAIKFFGVGEKWCAMYAGNDISPVTEISRFVREKLNPADAPETVPDVVAVFQQAFRQQITRRVETQILGSFDLTLKEFIATGLSQFGPEIFSRLTYEIENVRLDLSFLVIGFENSVPHMFVLQGKGEVSYFDTPGFWAIGSGQTSALGTLFSRKSGRSLIYSGMPEVLYTLCKAKFHAESAMGVGKEATAFVLKADGSRYVIYSGSIGKIKAIWEKFRPPDVPHEADAELENIIKEGKKLSQKGFRRLKRAQVRKAKKPALAEAKSAGEGQ